MFTRTLSGLYQAQAQDGCLSKSIYQKLMIIDSHVTVGTQRECGMFGALGKTGTFSNHDRDSGDNALLKNEFVFYLRLSTKLCKSFQYVYRSKNLLRLNMQRQRSLLRSPHPLPLLLIFRTHSHIRSLRVLFSKHLLRRLSVEKAIGFASLRDTIGRA